MPSSHPSPQTPSALVALVALGIVIRLRPAWAGVHLADAAAEQGVSAERVSRLISRAMAPFQALIETLVRRGRPPCDSHPDALETQLDCTRALLEVSTSVLARLGTGRRRARELIVGAWQRLSTMPGMTQQRLCAALALPARTLRDWLTTARSKPAEPKPSAAEPPKRTGRTARRQRRGRFGFDVVLPDTQMAADTTDIDVLGVRLKLMATQDIGGRDVDLLDGVLIDQTESADKIAQLFTETLAGLAGAQMLTDQGTPYMAGATTATLEQLGVEHVPQKEGHPTGKATIERAFKTIKDVGRGLFGITNRLAEHLPALSCSQLAIPVARTIVESLIRAYQCGARATREAIEARGGIDPQALEQASTQSRQQAQAVERSARLLLAHIHGLYEMRCPLKRFVDSLYRYPVRVLQEAEAQLRKQAHRADIGSWSRYFGAIVRNCNDEYQRVVARDRCERAEAAKRKQQHLQYEAQMSRWWARPDEWLGDALLVIAHQWIDEDRELLFSGVGPGLGLMASALRRMTELYCITTVGDIATGVANKFKHANADRFSPACIHATLALLNSELRSLDESVGDKHVGEEVLLSQLRLGGTTTAHDNSSATTSTSRS
jgi:transposase InsO family protein